MPQLSKRYLHKDIEERLYHVFLEHLANLHGFSLMSEFIECVFSKKERIMIAKRLAIAVLLSRGNTYDEIDETLKVSKSTITGIQRQLSLEAPGYKKAINDIEKRRMLEKAGDVLDELLLNVSMPAAVGSAKFRLKSEMGKEFFKRKRQRSAL
jgi:uncharacterized protein YerC